MTSAACLASRCAAQLELRGARRGDRFQAGSGRPPRSLKMQFQAAGAATWDARRAVALSGGVPVFVPGLGLDARAVAAPGEPQVALAWVAERAGARRPRTGRSLESRARQPRRAPLGRSDACRLPMALIVHKYGGTSMGSPERIRNVARRVAKWVRAGHQLVVVPSAMSGETNRLLGARQGSWRRRATRRRRCANST